MWGKHPVPVWGRPPHWNRKKNVLLLHDNLKEGEIQPCAAIEFFLLELVCNTAISHGHCQKKGPYDKQEASYETLETKVNILGFS